MHHSSHTPLTLPSPPSLTLSPLPALQDFVSAVMDVDYSPTGREFVAGSYDRSVRIFGFNAGHSREVGRCWVGGWVWVGWLVGGLAVCSCMWLLFGSHNM